MAGVEYAIPPAVVRPGEKRLNKAALRYRAVDFEGARHHVGDYVVLQQQRTEAVAEVMAIWEDARTREAMFRFRWFWYAWQVRESGLRPECRDEERELYAGDHVDVAPCTAILGRVTVLAREVFARLSKEHRRTPGVFFCEWAYSYRRRELTYLGRKLFPGDTPEKAGFEVGLHKCPTEVPDSEVGYATSNVAPTRLMFRPRLGRRKEKETTGVHII